MTRLLATWLTIVLATSTLIASAADPWPWWRGINHDGKSQDTGLLKAWPDGGPPLAWKQEGFGEGFSSVSVTQDAIYTLGKVENDLMLFRLKPADGSTVWKVAVAPARKVQYPGSRSTPTVDGERVYAIGESGDIRCFQTADGALVWSRTMAELGGKPGGWGFAESPLVDGDRLIVTPGGAHVFAALDKRTGKTVWQSSGFSAPAHYSSCIPVTFEGVRMIVNGTGGGLFAVNSEDGKLLWSSDFCKGNTANCPSPAFADGFVFWANGYRKGAVCMKLAKQGDSVTAEEAYRSTDMVNHHGGYVIVDGYVYGHDNGVWACLELATGKVMWKERGVGKGSICFADGMLYTFGERGGAIALVEANPKAYVEHGQFSVTGRGPSWAHPVVAAGRLFLRYDDNLYCFDVKAK